MKLWNPTLPLGLRTLFVLGAAGLVAFILIGLSRSRPSQARLLEMNLGITNSTEFRNIITKNDSSVWEKRHRIYLEGESNRIRSLFVGKGFQETVLVRDSASYWLRELSSAGRFPELPTTNVSVRFLERWDWSGLGQWDVIAVGPGGTQLWYRSFRY